MTRHTLAPAMLLAMLLASPVVSADLADLPSKSNPTDYHRGRPGMMGKGHISGQTMGVSEGILVAAGFGDQCINPSWENPDGGRRVELKILETDSGCTNVSFACQAAIDAGLVPDEVKKYLDKSCGSAGAAF